MLTVPIIPPATCAPGTFVKINPITPPTVAVVPIVFLNSAHEIYTVLYDVTERGVILGACSSIFTVLFVIDE